MDEFLKYVTKDLEEKIEKVFIKDNGTQIKSWDTIIKENPKYEEWCFPRWKGEA